MRPDARAGLEVQALRPAKKPSVGPSERDLGVRSKQSSTVAASLVNDIVSRIRKGVKG